MAKPFPVLRTSTPLDREKFTRQALENGFTWCGGAIREDSIISAKNSNNYCYAMLSNPYVIKFDIRFIESQEEFDRYKEKGSITVANSFRHFLEYTKKNF